VAPRTATAHESSLERVRDNFRRPPVRRPDLTCPNRISYTEYVKTHIRVEDAEGIALFLYVGNSGPTVATNVRVTFHPALRLPDSTGQADTAMTSLARPIASLTPGKTLRRNLGASHVQLGGATTTQHHVAVRASKPFGELAPLEYPINLADTRDSILEGRGSLHGLTRTVTDASKEIESAINAH